MTCLQWNSLFRLRDNSVQDCSPFSVANFIIFKRKLPCLLFDVAMGILIDNVLKQFYM